ncbi:hypothetical protein GCM10008171_03760 [Methylopila jiangsuensis]|uniref:Uncharacterized protein n=1 Tax=Methylopila jiangsuensis TaxID=586230 RepID=A0A9W6JD77_9HYPH|nr:hypothetical protein [Methylopila jiangsuensis]MDR6285366.1 hypothetical protein [Methylopila jiangsuensis]GLK75122.1 hypothetical protein GCM10008171_03760 [Methylopila jiangsuensis]
MLKRMIVTLGLLLPAAPHAVMAEEVGHRSVSVCKSVVVGADKLDPAALSEDDLKEKLCLSSLSVIRSADPMAGMECRLAFKTLLKEFSKRHPGKEMNDVYGRC